MVCIWAWASDKAYVVNHYLEACVVLSFMYNHWAYCNTFYVYIFSCWEANCFKRNKVRLTRKSWLTWFMKRQRGTPLRILILMDDNKWITVANIWPPQKETLRHVSPAWRRCSPSNKSTVQRAFPGQELDNFYRCSQHSGRSQETQLGPWGVSQQSHN